MFACSGLMLASAGPSITRHTGKTMARHMRLSAGWALAQHICVVMCQHWFYAGPTLAENTGQVLACHWTNTLAKCLPRPGRSSSWICLKFYCKIRRWCGCGLTGPLSIQKTYQLSGETRPVEISGWRCQCRLYFGQCWLDIGPVPL